MTQATIVLVTLLLSAPLAMATPANYHARYDIDFSGITIGKLDLTNRQVSDEYSATLVVETDGLAKLFRRFQSTTSIRGTVDAQNTLQPLAYESAYSLKKKPRSIIMKWTDSGEIETIAVEPHDTDRPIVAREQLTAALDPISALLTIFNHAARETPITLFDGKRLMQLVPEKLDASADRPSGLSDLPVLATRWRRLAIAGFASKELARMSEREQYATIYYHAQDPALPLLISVPAYFGAVNIRRKSVEPIAKD